MDFISKEPNSAACLTRDITRGVRRPLYSHPNTAYSGKRGETVRERIGWKNRAHH
jgi:hypothetical protein